MVDESLNQQQMSVESLDEFAHALRELRREAGDATLAKLSMQTGISKSVISEALMGRKLPTERTVSKLAVAFGANQDEWVRRRRALDVRVSAPVGGVAVAQAGPRVLSLTQATAFAAIAAMISALATVFVFSAFRQDASPATEGSHAIAFVAVENGADPMVSKCRLDSVIAGSEPRHNSEVQVQLMYSNECQAVWGRVTRYDGKSAGNSLSMRIYPEVNVESERSQERRARNVQSIYTPMLIEPDVEARVCGVAVITVDDVELELGPPLCI